MIGTGTKSNMIKMAIGKVSPLQSPQVNAKLTKLMKFCEKPRIRQEMQEFMGLKDKKNFIKNYIQPMIKLGVIRMTNPDKRK